MESFPSVPLGFRKSERLSNPGIIVWEHYLVYATSLKVADKVMKQLEVRLRRPLMKKAYMVRLS